MVAIVYTLMHSSIGCSRYIAWSIVVFAVDIVIAVSKVIVVVVLRLAPVNRRDHGRSQRDCIVAAVLRSVKIVVSCSADVWRMVN